MREQRVAVPLEPVPDVYIARGVLLLPETKTVAMALAKQLRREGLATVVATQRSLKGQMRHANALRVKYVVIIDADGLGELPEPVVQVRRMEDGAQSEVPLTQVAAYLLQALGKA